MPVATPSSASPYDRAPGVLYEEKRPAPPAPPATPTRRPSPEATAATVAATPASGSTRGRPTPTRKPGAYYEDPDTPFRTPTPQPTPQPSQ